jgi:hypothetical protein
MTLNNNTPFSRLNALLRVKALRFCAAQNPVVGG